MLWFNNRLEKARTEVTIFKYISCYGSTESMYDAMNILHIFKYISCYGSTYSIGTYKKKELSFKYISCYGSTKIEINNLGGIS